MPEIGRIQSTNFQSLLNSLGITRNNIPFGLQSEVMPVVLVGGTVSFLAAPTPAYRVQDVFTEGLLSAPVAGTLMADTGPLPIGAYSILVSFNSVTETNQFDFEWRDAANTATLRAIRLTQMPNSGQQFLSRFQVENDNERFRVLVVSTGGAVLYQVVILART